jgi:hypothetical protein
MRSKLLSVTQRRCAVQRAKAMDYILDWGPLFDRMIAAAGEAGDLVVLDSGEGDDAAYAAANEAIIREAQGLVRAVAGGPSSRLHAVIVWEGTAREGNDATGDFQELARKAGFEERIVLTR